MGVGGLGDVYQELKILKIKEHKDIVQYEE